jgi:hypothetical protein
MHGGNTSIIVLHRFQAGKGKGKDDDDEEEDNNKEKGRIMKRARA